MRTAAIVAFLLAAGAFARAQNPKTDEYVRNHGTTLDIGDQHGGRPLTWEGGGLRAATVEAGAKRSPGAVQFEDVRFTVGPVFVPALQEWIRGALAGAHPTNDVYLLKYKRDGSVDKSTRFPGSRIVEVVIPELKADGQDQARVTVAFQPGAAPELGGAMAAPAPAPPAGLRPLLQNEFSLSIDGINASDVFKISPIRVNIQAGSAPKVSNIVLKIYEHPVRFAAWTAWLQSFLVDGQSDDSKEKTGTLQIGKPASPAFVCSLKGLGIVRMSPLPAEPHGIVAYEVELYCEGVTLGADASAPPPPTVAPPPVAPPPLKGNAEDKGARDPADVPRFPDSVRTSFTSSLSRVQSEEKAEYVTAAAVDKVATHMADKMKELGWTLGTREETGSERDGTYRLDFRWDREKQKQVARLTLGRTKDGSTTIWWQVTTGKR